MENKIIIDDIEYKYEDKSWTVVRYKGDKEKVEIKSEIEGYPVTSIGVYAFNECTSLRNIEIPTSVISIGVGAFRECVNLTKIKIPNSVTSIRIFTFARCLSLRSIEIPSSVINIEAHVFPCCDALETIIVDKDNPVYDSRENCNAIIETKTNTLICGCQNTQIPNSVTTINGFAFSECNSLISIEIPSCYSANYLRKTI